MKRLTLFVCLIITSWPPAYSAVAVTEDSKTWPQYRLNPKNNPVVTNDALSGIASVFTTDNEVRSTPVVVGNRIYIGNHDSGNLQAFNLESGERLWKNRAPNWVHSEMIYADDQLFVGYGNRFYQDEQIRGTDESGVLSLDPETGEIAWNFETDGEVMPTPAFHDDTVYVTTGDRHLYGLAPDDGALKWSLNLGSIVSMSSPVIKDGILYVGGSRPYAFQAVNLGTREIKWATLIENVTTGLDDVPPIVSDSGLVYTTGVKVADEFLSLKEVFDADGVGKTYEQILRLSVGRLVGRKPYKRSQHDLYALDTNSGDIVWERSLGKGAMVFNNKSGAPMLYNGKLFVGSPITKKFYAFDAENGEQLWEYESHVNKAPPVADGDVVYFTDAKGLVYGFDTESGDLLGRKMLGGTLAPSGPILVNDNLIVASQDTNVYAVPTEEIIRANDTAGQNSNLVPFVIYVYALPLLGFLLIMMLVILLIRAIRKSA
ncbi:PQQ-binding-like beta-propeller repeat protein [Halomonas sp. PR-M31]|uniref:outer membrane protein assembly factor BamB family protein n=1 Tax=Halomonas sp. PR-M31 TaxID=1471202 RepID=UPI00069CF61C|nr:PQQ-binding-like beta-propeller repeat protein [Halomonas sp. PR-M31]